MKVQIERVREAVVFEAIDDNGDLILVVANPKAGRSIKNKLASALGRRTVDLDLVEGDTITVRRES